MGVTTYYFDVLRLMLEYILGENYFCSVIHMFSHDSYSNVLNVITLVSQYVCHKM